MENPAYQPLFADRYNPLVLTVTFPGKNLTGCVVHGQVRRKVNSITSPVADLPIVTIPVDSGFMLLSASPTGSSLRMCVTKEDLALFTSADDAGDVYVRYDITVTEADGFTSNVWVYGPLIIRAGVDNG
jgi:hypothetical protein